jgi:hypothetical protein
MVSEKPVVSGGLSFGPQKSIVRTEDLREGQWWLDAVKS